MMTLCAVNLTSCGKTLCCWLFYTCCKSLSRIIISKFITCCLLINCLLLVVYASSSDKQLLCDFCFTMFLPGFQFHCFVLWVVIYSGYFCLDHGYGITQIPYHHHLKPGVFQLIPSIITTLLVQCVQHVHGNKNVCSCIFDSIGKYLSSCIQSYISVMGQRRYYRVFDDDVIKWKHFPRNWPLCGVFTGPGEFPTQRPVTRSFDVFFDLCLNKRLSKQPWGWWFETLSWSLWRHRNGYRRSFVRTIPVRTDHSNAYQNNGLTYMYVKVCLM